MANFKKEDKASILARLEVLEKKVTLLAVESLDHESRFLTGSGLTVGYSQPSSITTSVVPAVTITSVATQVLPEVKHKCQTNTCESMETKEYQGKDRKMWLCDSHKF